MSFESLKENIQYEKDIVQELFIFKSQLEQARFLKRRIDERILSKAIEALINLLKITNNSIPKILESKEVETKPIEVKVGKETAGVEKEKAMKKVKEKLKPEEKLIRVSYEAGGRRFVTIGKEDEKKFLNQLSLSLDSIKKLKKHEEKSVGIQLFKKPSFYAKFSNKFFSKYSNSLMNKGYFKNVNSDMRKANMPFLLNTYISIALMTAFLGLIAGIVSFVILALTIESFLWYLLLIPGIPVLVLLSFYFYPSLEKGDKGNKVNQELPFVVIHMSAVAGSGIEPSKIFRIIAIGEEYPNTKQELKKVINQINVYGYDLVNALKNAARSTASKKIAELFNGLATTISSGGSLTEFLDKRAETLLFEYRLERERFTRTAETFMDIYISVVIAAPMIMMLMLILLSITGIGIGLSIQALGLIIVLIVALINIFFLFILHLKQPRY